MPSMNGCRRKAHAIPPDSKEYERVVEEWIAIGRPNGIAAFIAVRANIGPDGSAHWVEMN